MRNGKKKESKRKRQNLLGKRMADTLLVGVSQSSLLQVQRELRSFRRLQLFSNSGYLTLGYRQLHLKGVSVARVVSSDSKAPTILTNTVESTKGSIDIEVDRGNGGGDNFDDRSGGGGGGGGDNSGGGDSDSKGEGEFSEDGGKKKMSLSMSQKLTLGYAALVGVGGLMGYMKSGSQKSLLAGGLSAAVLYYVHTVLPTKPVYASSIGLGISAALLGVMGSRFKRSGKVFPAGVVSLVSLVMAGGYLHGIMRSLH